MPLTATVVLHSPTDQFEQILRGKKVPSEVTFFLVRATEATKPVLKPHCVKFSIRGIQDEQIDWISTKKNPSKTYLLKTFKKISHMGDKVSLD